MSGGGARAQATAGRTRAPAALPAAPPPPLTVYVLLQVYDLVPHGVLGPLPARARPVERPAELPPTGGAWFELPGGRWPLVGSSWPPGVDRKRCRPHKPHWAVNRRAQVFGVGVERRWGLTDARNAVHLRAGAGCACGRGCVGRRPMGGSPQGPARSMLAKAGPPPAPASFRWTWGVVGGARAAAPRRPGWASHAGAAWRSPGPSWPPAGAPARSWTRTRGCSAA